MYNIACVLWSVRVGRLYCTQIMRSSAYEKTIKQTGDNVYLEFYVLERVFGIYCKTEQEHILKQKENVNNNYLSMIHVWYFPLSSRKRTNITLCLRVTSCCVFLVKYVDSFVNSTVSNTLYIIGSVKALQFI